jgi:hypothetical protein
MISFSVMDVAVTYFCECTQKNYKSKTALLNHKKTKIHTQWEQNAELRNLKIAMTHKDNEIVKLKTDKELLQDLNLVLVRKIKGMQE